MSSVSASGNLYLRNNSGTPQYSLNNSSWTSITFPFTINNLNTANTLIVNFTTDLVINDVSFDGFIRYFICGSDNIQFGSESLNLDGTRRKITIDGIANYPGLIQNGSSGGNGYGKIRIFNLFIDTVNGSTLSNVGGWIGQQYYSKGNGANLNYIVNCVSNGPINGGGGITGSFTSSFNGRLVIRGCSSSGNITGGGGIVGPNSASYDNSQLIIEYCSNTSASYPSNDCAGIVGPNSGTFTGSVIVGYSYTTGEIRNGAGGIYGFNSGTDGSVVAEYCYSTGIITTTSGSSGGIFSLGAGLDTGSALANNCYSTGAISAGCGGIFGSSTLGNITATNCYTCGASTASPSGGIIAGSSLDGPNNYSEANHGSSGWNDTNANTVLDNIGTASNNRWIVNGINQPYLLNATAPTPYSVNNIDPTPADGYNFYDNYVQTVSAGNPTIAAVIPDYTSYTIISTLPPEPSITIDSTTGQISTTADTPEDNYLVLIYSQGPASYAITEFDLTVSSAGPAPSPTQPPLLYATEERYRGDDYRTITTYHAGNTLIADKQQNTRAKFPSYREYMYYRISAGSSFT